jgi:hypothetical protein
VGILSAKKIYVVRPVYVGILELADLDRVMLETHEVSWA